MIIDLQIILIISIWLYINPLTLKGEPFYDIYNHLLSNEEVRFSSNYYSEL